MSQTSKMNTRSGTKGEGSKAQKQESTSQAKPVEKKDNKQEALKKVSQQFKAKQLNKQPVKKQVESTGKSSASSTKPPPQSPIKIEIRKPTVEEEKQDDEDQLNKQRILSGKPEATKSKPAQPNEGILAQQ